MKTQQIGFIGAGNMARSLSGGLISSGVNSKNLFATDHNEAARDAISEDFSIQTFPSNQALLDEIEKMNTVKDNLLN